MVRKIIEIFDSDLSIVIQETPKLNAIELNVAIRKVKFI